MVKTLVLYALTALMELLGCYLPYLWLRQGRSALLLIPAALCLGLFAWLLSLHPAASGRVYAAYGAVYVSMALLWLRLVDGVVPTGRDLLGVAVVLVGLGVLISGAPPRR
ncbi:MAG: YnfA family protein [Synechococcaceae bacterium WBB_3_034]|jgi:small multidrug resistance family-3 protein|nr:YnfA family protein [Synechococcaceae bacterium WBB_3_034]NDG22322.1 YnfA family protein [Synechococcaceae bacterium WBB_10_009]